MIVRYEDKRRALAALIAWATLIPVYARCTRIDPFDIDYLTKC